MEGLLEYGHGILYNKEGHRGIITYKATDCFAFILFLREGMVLEKAYSDVITGLHRHQRSDLKASLKVRKIGQAWGLISVNSWTLRRKKFHATSDFSNSRLSALGVSKNSSPPSLDSFPSLSSLLCLCDKREAHNFLKL